MVNQEGVFADKLSPWASYVTRYEKNVTFDHTFWNPPQVLACLNIMCILKLFNILIKSSGGHTHTSVICVVQKSQQ